jgi:predicted secreted protein
MAASTAKLALASTLGIQSLTGTGGIDTVTIANGGSGYSAGNILTVTQGGASGGTLLVVHVTGGAVDIVTRLTPGVVYGPASGLATTVSPAGGTGCTITLVHINWPVAELETIGGPSQKVATIAVTNMDSPSQYAEYIAGVIEAGEIAFSGNFTNATYQAQALADLAARTQRTWEVLFPGGLGTFSFLGFVIACSPEAKKDKQLTFSMSLKIDGPVTFTA